MGGGGDRRRWFRMLGEPLVPSNTNIVFKFKFKSNFSAGCAGTAGAEGAGGGGAPDGAGRLQGRPPRCARAPRRRPGSFFSFFFLLPTFLLTALLLLLLSLYSSAAHASDCDTHLDSITSRFELCSPTCWIQSFDAQRRAVLSSARLPVRLPVCLSQLRRRLRDRQS
eukprot:COSAG01_NODE_2829_length_6998_cov_487.185824_7_plen_167_part_00